MNRLILIILTLSTVSCGNIIDITEADNAKARWGYYSEYIGAINEAQLPTNEDKKLMAEAIQPAINMANALIQPNIIAGLAPDIVAIKPTGNIRDPWRDNSTCVDSSGNNDNGTTYREYRQFYNVGAIPIDFVYVKYNNYCSLNDAVKPTTSKTTIKSIETAERLPGAKTESVMDNNSEIYYYMILNRDVTIERVGDALFNGSYTPFGILKRTGMIGNLQGSKFLIGVDIKGTDNKINRFDVSFTGLSPATKELTFFHTRYGYVTVTINNTTPIKDTDEITFKYSGSTCTFTNQWLKDPFYMQKINENCYYK